MHMTKPKNLHAYIIWVTEMMLNEMQTAEIMGDCICNTERSTVHTNSLPNLLKALNFTNLKVRLPAMDKQ